MVPARVALYVAALIGALVIGPRGPVYWDSFGYIAQALTGRVGGLALGRPVFVLVSHALAVAYQSVGGSVWSLEPVVRVFWLAVAASAAPATHAVAESCGLSARGALLAGLAVALSPAMAHTSDAVLTDAPSFALAVVGIALAARAVTAVTTRAASDVRTWGDEAWAFGAGAAFGAAFGLREQAVVQLAVPALMVPLLPRAARARFVAAVALGFALTGVVPVAYVAATQRGYLATVSAWARAMQRERAQHPYRLRDFGFYLAWLVALGPATLVAAGIAWARHWRELLARWSVVLAVTAPALVQLLLLGGYQDISYSPRYLLCALSGALAIPAALVLDRWAATSKPRAVVVAVALMAPVAIGAPMVRASERGLRTALRTLPTDLANVPADSVVVTGQPCPAVGMIRQMARSSGQRPVPAWQPVCPGWSWPSDLAARLDEARQHGRVVVLDLRPASWLGGQRVAMAQAARYLAGHADAQQRGEIVVWR